jgi:hypothetical protein
MFLLGFAKSSLSSVRAYFNGCIRTLPTLPVSAGASQYHSVSAEGSKNTRNPHK